MIGAGWQAWLGGAGARIALYDRMSFAPPRTWSDTQAASGLELRHSPTLGLDVMVRFGGEQ